MLRTHQANITTIERAIDRNKGANDELKDIDSLLEQLTNMKHTGSDCIRIIQAFNRARLNPRKGLHETFSLISISNVVSHFFSLLNK